MMDATRRRTSARHVALIVTACVVTLGIVLGLGIGLGMQSTENRCFDSMQFNDTLHYDPNKAWSGVCPKPGQASCPNGINSPLILISMDGFRAEYLNRNMTPTMLRLSECGFRAPFLRSVYPSKTFPNHYTIATGLYPESHGIVANRMYDMDLNEDFSLGKPTRYNAHWWKGEPIWNTVVKAGKKALTIYWPGSQVAIQDMRPTACYNYDESVPFEDRVNEVMGYFDTDPEKYPDFIAFYLHEPDGAGHRSGPYGDWLKGNLSDVDHILNMLLSGLEQKSLDSCVNVVIVSDHGMDSIDCSRTIDLAPYFGTMLDELHFYDKEQVRITSQFIYKDGQFVETSGGATADEILDKLKCKYYNDTKDRYVRFDKKEDLPKRFHYSNNIRIEEVIGEVQTQYLAFRDASKDGLRCTGGAHGFDPAYDTMHAIFLGAGPSFKGGIKTDPVENIEVYNLVADLLHLDNRAPTNGTSGSLHYLLSTATPLPDASPVDGVYGSCPYPVDEHQANLRRNNTKTCNWVDIKNFTTTPIADIDAQLNLQTSAVSQSVRDHAPLGVPEVDFSDATLCQLTQRSYVIGYSDQHHMPLWTAFKLTKNASCSILNKTCFGSHGAVPDLIRPDVRLNTDSQPECDLYTNNAEKIKGHFLFPPGLINTRTNPDQVFDGYISTNVVPMYDKFRTGVWQELLYLLEEYTYKYGDLRVMAGPIFDYNADGKRDSLDEIRIHVSNDVIPLPTHYYMIAFRCKDVNVYPGNCTSDIAVLSVILRHRADVTNCWDRRYAEYIEKNVARVRDIELLTGLRFHTEVTEAERLRISVFLSEALWDRKF